MSDKSLSARINNQLAECEQIYEKLESVISDPSATDSSSIPHDQRNFVLTTICYLLESVENVEHLLKQAVLGDAIQDIAPRPLQFYREALATKQEDLANLLVELLELPDFDLDETQFRKESIGTPAWNILVSGLDYWSMDDNENYAPEELKATERLVYSSFFQPDEWLRNVDELEPVLGEAAKHKIPSNVRVRIRELYRSFILANYLSSIALARAILEYALVDRAARIGINAYSDEPRYPHRTRKLGALVEDASENIPELAIEMEAVVEAGNRVLHPKKKDRVILLPSHLRTLAKTSIESVRKIVEQLYLHL